MNTGIVRGLPVPGVEIAEAVDDRGWIRSDGDSVSLDWPDAEYLTVLGSWHCGGVLVTLVQDELILRSYLCSADAAGAGLFHELADDGILLLPSALLATAQASTWWAEQGDTLYELVAGGFDLDPDDVYEVWSTRLQDEHPLVRSSACWAAPYLDGDRIADRLDVAAATDESPEVREAAAESAAVIRKRSGRPEQSGGGR